MIYLLIIMMFVMLVILKFRLIIGLSIMSYLILTITGVI